MREIQISKMVLDMAVYPRCEVDQDHVFNLVEALKNHHQLPPIVICGQTSRIVDGAHRLQAFKRMYGDSGMVEVACKRYADDSELLLDAMRYNARHGKNLGRDDRTHAGHLAQKLSISPDLIAGALGISRTLAGGLVASVDFSAGLTPVRAKKSSFVVAGRQSKKTEVKTVSNIQVDELPRNRKKKLSGNSGDADSAKAEELSFLLDDAAIAIQNAEFDLANVHKNSALGRALTNLRDVVAKAIKEVGIKR